MSASYVGSMLLRCVQLCLNLTRSWLAPTSSCIDPPLTPRRICWILLNQTSYREKYGHASSSIWHPACFAPTRRAMQPEGRVHFAVSHQDGKNTPGRAA